MDKHANVSLKYFRIRVEPASSKVGGKDSSWLVIRKIICFLSFSCACYLLAIVCLFIEWEELKYEDK